MFNIVQPSSDNIKYVQGFCSRGPRLHSIEPFFLMSAVLIYPAQVYSSYVQIACGTKHGTYVVSCSVFLHSSPWYGPPNPNSMLFAAFWSLTLPFARYLQHLGALASHRTPFAAFGSFKPVICVLFAAFGSFTCCAHTYILPLCYL